MNLIDLVQGQLSDGVMDALAKQIGGSQEQTRAATNGIVSTLVAALSKNAARPGGVDALVSAVDRDHDGSILDDALGFLSGGRKSASSSMLNGAGILKHVLGGRQNGVVDMIGRLTGLDQSNVGKLMMTLAPMVMGAIGRARNKQGMSVRGIGDLLGNTVKSESNQRSEMGLLTRFLDQDGDGSIMDDLANIGMKAFLR